MSNPATPAAAAAQPAVTAQTDEQKSAAELKIRIDVIKASYAASLNTGTTNERAARLLKMNEEINAATRESMRKSGTRIEVVGQNDPWARHKEALANNGDKISGKAVVFANARPEGRTRRQSQGYAPVSDSKNQEVRVGDSVLMGMPMDQFIREREMPKEAQRAAQLSAVEREFHDAGAELGVETSGRIKYDGRRRRR